MVIVQTVSQKFGPTIFINFQIAIYAPEPADLKGEQITLPDKGCETKIQLKLHRY
jgi:hypothetical protein